MRDRSGIAAERVGSGRTKNLQTLRIDRVNNHRRANRLFSNPLQEGSHVAGIRELVSQRSIIPYTGDRLMEKRIALPELAFVLSLDRQVVGKEHEGLTTRKFAHALENKTQGSEGLIVSVSAAIGGSRIFGTSRYENRDTHATTAIPSQTLERAVQESLVVGELLQHAQLATSAEDGYQVVRLQLFRDELLHLLPDLAHALG